MKLFSPRINTGIHSALIALSLLFLLLFLPLAGCKGQSSSGGGSNKPGDKSAASPVASGDVSADEGGKFSVASPVPDFEISDLAGKKVTLKNFNGKIVLLNFWATWCVPCVAEMGSLERLYKTYKDRNFEIVGINVDAAENDAVVSKFVKSNGISFTVLRDPEMSLPPEFGLSGFPESIFLDGQQHVMAFNDPTTERRLVRVVGDRSWDSPNFLKSVGELLAKK